MMKPISLVRQQFDSLGYPNHPVTTSQIRRVSAQVFRQLESKDIESVLEQCEILLATQDWACGVVAYDWAFRVRKQYTEATFEVFERWLFTYIKGWGDCDDFCTHAFGELLAQNNALFPRVLQWVEHPNFAVQRSAAVILIYPINKGRDSGLKPLLVADKLMGSDHHLVQKGYGWMLKVLSRHQPQMVIDYLRLKHKQMPRTAFRYAIEKLDKTTKSQLMSLN